MQIYRTAENISVRSDYSPYLPNPAKNISGKWDSTNRLWVYPISAEPQVKKLYLDIYGTWDEPRK